MTCEPNDGPPQSAHGPMTRLTTPGVFMKRSPDKGDSTVAPEGTLLLLSSRRCATTAESPMISGYGPRCMHILFNIRAVVLVVNGLVEDMCHPLPGLKYHRPARVRDRHQDVSIPMDHLCGHPCTTRYGQLTSVSDGCTVRRTRSNDKAPVRPPSTRYTFESTTIAIHG